MISPVFFLLFWFVILTKLLFLRNVNAKLHKVLFKNFYIFLTDEPQWHLIQKLEICSQRKMRIKILVCMHTTSLKHQRFAFSYSAIFSVFPCGIKKYSFRKRNVQRQTKKKTFLVGGTLGGLKNVASRGLTAVGSSGITVDSLDTSLISVRSWGQYQKK